MNRGVLFLHVGSKYAVPLAVAVASLRKFYDGPIAVLCDPDAGRASALAIASDRRLQPLDVLHHRHIRERFLRSESWAYVFKTRLPGLSPFKSTIMLDSDIVVTGPIGELWCREDEYEPNWVVPGDAVVLTKRNGGRHQNLKARLRCRKWAHIDAARAARSQDRAYPYPPINTGVMAFGSDSGAFCAEWRRMAEANPVHSCDEQAAQLIYPDFPVRLADYRFNASLIHDRELTDVRIWHGVGKFFWNDARGRAVWLPAFRECLRENLGNVRELLDTFSWVGGRTWRELQSAARGYNGNQGESP